MAMTNRSDPLTAKGEEIMKAMKEQYGPEKGERVFYASANAGKITGVHDAKDDDCKGYLDACRRGDAATMSRRRDSMLKKLW